MSTPKNRPMPAKRPHDEAARRNSLGLSRAEMEAVWEQLDGGSDQSSPRRQAARLPFREVSVQIEIVQPGGGQTGVSVACRNLSRTGLGFLHSAYVHTGTTVIAHLPHKTQGVVKVPGTVVRCRHVTRHIHDVGVNFKQPLNLHEYLELDMLSESFSSENVDAAALKGVLLVVAEYKIDQACVQSMLRETGLDFVLSSTVEDGIAQAMKGVNIILCDDLFTTGSGAEFIAKARSSGVRCPIIIMSADRSAEAKSRIRAADASGYISKPLDQRVMLRAMAEFLIVSGDAGADQGQLYSTLPITSPMANLADDFVNDLRAAADDIDKLVKAGDGAAIRRHCLRIVGTAPALGFDSIAKLAGGVMTSLDRSPKLDDSVVAINTFAATCRAVRRRPKAA